MPYRSEIDGLRALAILAVLFFHAAIPGVPGGFLGVDVFFVLSGYLITSITVGEMDSGRFSLLDFYRRRVVRILPALLTMLLVVAVAGWLLLFPLELRLLAWSGAAASSLVANLYFWQNHNYFGPASESKILLHCWSLGVEEQFYLLYPLLLWVAYRFRRELLLPLAGIATFLSLVAAAMLAKEHPMVAFYLLPTRAWELGLGALVALGAFPRVPARLEQGLALVGLAMLVGPCLVLDNQNSAPFPVALPSTMGTALLIAYGGTGFSARLLSIPVLRWIGRRSYSLYLWHWPILAFWRTLTGYALGAGETVLLIGAALAAAALSYRFIELPFRRRFRSGRPGPVVAAGAAALVLTTAGFIALGIGSHFLRSGSPEVARVAAYADYAAPGMSAVYQYRPACREPARRWTCMIPDPARRNVLVMGDSHAQHIWRAIALRFPEDHVMLATDRACRPVIHGLGSAHCREFFASVRRTLVESGFVQAVVLASRWKREDIDPLADTIRAIRAHGVKVTVIGPVVEYGSTVPLLLARAIALNDRGWIERTRTYDREALDRAMEPRVLAAGGQYYSIYRQECPAGAPCRLLTRDGAPFHFDYGHFTLSGSRDLVEHMPPP